MKIETRLERVEKLLTHLWECLKLLYMIPVSACSTHRFFWLDSDNTRSPQDSLEFSSSPKRLFCIFYFFFRTRFLLVCCVLKNQSLKHIDTTWRRAENVNFWVSYFSAVRRLSTFVYKPLSRLVESWSFFSRAIIKNRCLNCRKKNQCKKSAIIKKAWLHTKARLNHNTQINVSSLRFCLPRLLYVLNPGSRRRKKYKK